MPRKKLNKVHRHTVRFDQYTEDCVKEAANNFKLKVNEYIERLVKNDCADRKVKH